MPLKAPTPALSASRRAIENAFKDLERTISPAESRDFASTTLEDVRRAAMDLERQLAARQSLRNMRRLEPLFQGLHHYSKVIVLCNGTDYLPWIWAPIKLILKRFQPQLYPVFVIFYADILRFHKAAYKFIIRRSWKILFLTTWGRFEREFETIIADLKRHEELIDKEVNAHNIVEARTMRETLRTWRTENLEQLAQEQKQQTARQMQSAITWLRLDDSDQIVLFDSLAKVGERYPGTVDWVLKRPQVTSWLRSTPDHPFLWLQGGPGTGKSVIAAQLLSFLNASKGSLVIRHFCSYTHDSSIQYDQIIKSLLLQAAQRDADLVAHIHEEYVVKKEIRPFACRRERLFLQAMHDKLRMFLWACLVLDYLAANLFYSGDEFMRAVDALPRELTAFYEKLLSRILSGLDIRSALRLRAIFGWIAFAKRPLRKAELQSALMFQTDESIGARPVPAHALEASPHLQSGDCSIPIRMEEGSIRWDHGLASLRCIRSAFDVLSPGFPQNLRQVQIIRGVWGFVPYATEFWAVDLQELTVAPTEKWDCRFISIASNLSTFLAKSRPGPEAIHSGQLIEELEGIRQNFPNLWCDATLSLQARASGQHRADGLNLAASEFERFCNNFGGHAYLCRFISCVHATSGFGSSEERQAHEADHKLSFPCAEQGCQYPPFSSQKSLRRHLSEKHGKGGRRRPANRATTDSINPLTGDNVLNDFDFDSFLHDDTGEHRSFDFTQGFMEGGEIGDE
ncbi:hypothetical protein B0T24DRAFT_650675 [Lasiosphaeria ovina]|uniref:Nephrocystin 3-like N-terminal domain-containing protein n=1 Tax=Lasiosphaeria ovina TaxID=92902 RepID=A0AAE0K2M9_9PEZI|nr:hypothetical protein B0T24DRAFT_650675 [Lasiosphaeria ovina]